MELKILAFSVKFVYKKCRKMYFEEGLQNSSKSEI